jgi:RNA polymerase sigma-70 factor (ECF subfamily)
MGESSAYRELEVGRWIEEARGKWPHVALGEPDFRRYLTALGVSVLAFPNDAYLAAASAAGDVAALRALEEEYFSQVPGMLRRIDGSPEFAANVCQLLRIRLLVGEDGAPPRIARYTGEVPMGAWIRVIALRLALNAKRGAKTNREDASDAEPMSLSTDDPEVEYLRAHYRDTFVRSFHGALASLPKDDRTILRLHYVDGVNIDGIGRIFQVHRATIARWLVRIRADVLERSKALLAEQVGAELDEAESVLGVLAGEVDLTLSRVLKGTQPGT